MKKNLFLLGCMTSLAMLSFQSCGNEDELPSTTNTKVVLMPSSVNNCVKEEVALLRKIAAKNDISSDFASDNPSEWKYDHLQIVWDTIPKSVQKTYIVKELRGPEGKEKGLKDFTLTDDKETFKHLERIDIKSAQLGKFGIANVPLLRTIIINGKSLDASNNDLTMVEIHDLPKLDSIHVENFPKLIKSNTDDLFYISLYYQYPKLSYVGVVNTGIKELKVEPEKPLKELVLSGNKDITSLTLEEVSLNDITFTKETYPKLEVLNLKKLSGGKSKDLVISGLDNLTNVNLFHDNWLSKAEVTDCAKLKELILSDCNLSENTCKLSNLPELITFDIQGNNFSALNIGELKKVKNLDLTNNKFTTTDNITLSAAAEKLPLQGNENLQKVDLTPYKKLWIVNVNGYKRGQDVADHNNPLSFANINLNGLTDLESVRVNNNSLASVFDGNTVYPSLGTLEAEYNAINPIGMVNIAKSIESFDGLSLKLGYQTFAVNVKDNKTVDYSMVNGFFTNKGKKLSFEVTLGEDVVTDGYTYNNGIFTFSKAGTYKLSSESFNDILNNSVNDYKSKPFTIE
ncbi:leucine-rich repeat domain-containing protein [Prevotella bivia]|uniref:leucine-rich repeat domain-containing protein n=3 Tax=Prevotella TaxID=838 RepID=UPI00288BED7B|nr:leucine-rich repeat domain-containing protein [Prevotella bivia]